jgi:hypothetical protein
VAVVAKLAVKVLPRSNHERLDELPGLNTTSYSLGTERDESTCEPNYDCITRRNFASGGPHHGGKQAGSAEYKLSAASPRSNESD